MSFREMSEREAAAFKRYYGGTGCTSLEEAFEKALGNAVDHYDWERNEAYRCAQLALISFRENHGWFCREEDSDDHGIEGFDPLLPVEQKVELYKAQLQRELIALDSHESWEMDRD